MPTVLQNYVVSSSTSMKIELTTIRIVPLDDVISVKHYTISKSNSQDKYQIRSVYRPEKQDRHTMKLSNRRTNPEYRAAEQEGDIIDHLNNNRIQSIYRISRQERNTVEHLNRK